jgi:hypothetical protein
MSLNKGAEDRWGNSLEKDFYHRFFTGQDRRPPVLTGSDPEDFALLNEERASLSLSFSEALDRGSFNSALSFTPDILMNREWNSTGDRVTLYPLEAYDSGVNYYLTLSDYLKDLAGNSLSTPIELGFRRSVREPVSLLELSLSGSRRLLLSYEEGQLNTGLEKNLILEGIFNAPISYDQQSSLFSLQPSLPLDLSWKEDNTGFTLSFGQYLSYGESYRLSVGEKRYDLFIDGVNSRPLKLSEVVFCPDAEAVVPIMTPLSLNSSLGAVDSSHAFFDFYLEHAPGASISLSSFIEALSLESAVMSFAFTSLELGDGGLSPSPDPLPLEDVSVLRLRLGINGSGPGGTLLIKLDGDLRDSLDNCLDESWSLTVSQP